MRSALFFCLVAGVGALACSSDDGASNDVPVIEEARSSIERDRSPEVSSGEAAALARDTRAFAFDLYGRARESAELAGRNVFLSPISVTYALAMASVGARGDTLAGMRAAMHSSLPQERVHAALNGLSLALAERPARALAVGRGSAPLELSLVNALWAQRDVAFETPALDTLAISYGAGVNLLDFLAAPEPSRATINGWVGRATGNRIEELLPAGAIETTTRLVLVNAVALSAPWGWSKPFDPRATSDGAFARLDGSAATLPMMHRVDEALYVSNGDVEAVDLPLLGGELSMFLALPTSREPGAFAGVETALDATRFEALVAALEPRSIALALPKFRLRTPSVSLRPALESLGMAAAFGGTADFSGFTGDTSLYLYDVLHQALLGLDENGIEAAAATAAVLNEKTSGGGSGEPVPFVVDRPFFVGIRDGLTGALLFWGRIVDPSGG
jgi:serpin B